MFGLHSCKGPRKTFQWLLPERFPPPTSAELSVLRKWLQVIILPVVTCGLEGKSIIFLTWQTYFIQPRCLLLFTVGEWTCTRARPTEWRLLWWLYEKQVGLLDEWGWWGNTQDILSFSARIKRTLCSFAHLLCGDWNLWTKHYSHFCLFMKKNHLAYRLLSLSFCVPLFLHPSFSALARASMANRRVWTY